MGCPLWAVGGGLQVWFGTTFSASPRSLSQEGPLSSHLNKYHANNRDEDATIDWRKVTNLTFFLCGLGGGGEFGLAEGSLADFGWLLGGRAGALGEGVPPIVQSYLTTNLNSYTEGGFLRFRYANVGFMCGRSTANQ